jgi:hypothetical protein
VVVERHPGWQRGAHALVVECLSEVGLYPRQTGGPSAPEIMDSSLVGLPDRPAGSSLSAREGIHGRGAAGQLAVSAGSGCGEVDFAW